MQRTHTITPWLPRLASFLLAALAAGSAAYWGLRLSANQTDSLPPPAPTPLMAPDVSAVSRGLGGLMVSSTDSGPLRLLGVIAPTHAPGTGGAALIAVDDRAAKTFAIGQIVSDNWVLRSVQARQITLERLGQSRVLTLPPAPGSEPTP